MSALIGTHKLASAGTAGLSGGPEIDIKAWKAAQKAAGSGAGKGFNDEKHVYSLYFYFIITIA